MESLPQYEILGAITTTLAAVIGFWAVVWQIGRQARIGMKMRAYEQITEACEQAADSSSDFSNFILQLLWEVEGYAASNKSPDDLKRLSVRASEMLELQSRQARAQVMAIRTVERWLVIDPRLEVFKLAFVVCSYEANNTFFPKFFPLAAPKMPTDLRYEENGKIALPPAVCTPEELKEISRLGNILIKNLDEFSSFLYDFQVEMQTLLMRGLFNHRVPLRRPIDPSAVVLTLKNHKALMKRLNDETEGGRYMKQIDDETRRKFDEPTLKTPSADS